MLGRNYSARACCRGCAPILSGWSGFTQADLRVAILFNECIGDLLRAGVRVQRPGNRNLARENFA
jgi:hypothetical protein